MTTTKNELKTFDMMNDMMFKSVFRSVEARNFICTFLSAVTKIKKEELLNAAFVGGEHIKDRITEKGKISDIIVRLSEKHQIIVECNKGEYDSLFDINTSYAFTVYNQASKISEEEHPMIILINIDNFNKFHREDPILMFQIQDEYGDIESDTYLSYHVIVENAKKKGYNIDENVMRFAKFFSSTNLEELKNSTEGDEEIMSAYKKVEELVQDENFIGYYDAAERFEKEKQGYKATGIREGFEQGREENQKKIINNLKKMNTPIEDISKITELSLDEIHDLLKD